MDTIFFDAITLACGVYLLYVWYRLRSTGKLFSNGLLIPKGKKMEECMDAAAYIAYLLPKLLIIGSIVTICSLLGVANYYLELYGFWTSEILIGISLAAVVWYAICNGKAMRRFWP